MTERKLVIVRDGGILSELGGICGPIPNPTRIPVKKIIDMIVHNRTVFECDPADPRNEEKRVKLTLLNVKQDNFGSNASKPEEKKPEVPVTPKKEEPIVEPISQEVIKPRFIEPEITSEAKSASIDSVPEIKSEEPKAVEQKTEEPKFNELGLEKPKVNIDVDSVVVNDKNNDEDFFDDFFGSEDE